jgi:phosphatidate cytidylyltransferase
VWFILATVFAGERHFWQDDPALWLGVVGGIALTLFFLMGGLLLATGTRSPRELFWKHARLLWGVCYIGLLYPFVYLIGAIGEYPAGYSFSGGDLLLFLFGILWLGDTAAMGIGKWLGRNKLAPSISPGKSVEGFLAGILGALVVGVIMYFWLMSSLEWQHILVLSAGCSIFGQLGDLVESMWKRSIGIKDSSAIIPGHGGVLDRFDSLLFAAPFMYWYLSLIFMG